MRLLFDIIETVVRTAVSALLAVSVCSLYNLVVYKCSALAVLAMLCVVVAYALLRLVKRRKLATSHEEIETLFPTAKDMYKRIDFLYGLSKAIMLASIVLSLFCTTVMVKEYDGIDAQMVEEYEVTDDAVAMLRSIPGTLAARAFYVVVTPMENFDFDYYDKLVLVDRLLLALFISQAVTGTTVSYLKRYGESVRRIEDANY